MKRIFWLTFPFVVAIVSCEKRDFEESVERPVDNPVEDIAWLKESIRYREQLEENEFAQYQYIAQAEYQGETVFIQGNCCPTCNSVISVVNSDDELVGFLGNDEDAIDSRILEEAVIIWKPTGGVCSLN